MTVLIYHRGMKKICKRCALKKKLEDFYCHPKTSDGHVNFCKECDKKRIRDYRANNYEICKEIDRKKYLKRREKAAKWQREYMQKNEEARFKKWINDVVSKAKRLKLIKAMPCEICGKKKAQAHHSDYLQPYNIQWLCDYHHKQWHRENKPKVPKTLTRTLKRKDIKK